MTRFCREPCLVWPVLSPAGGACAAGAARFSVGWRGVRWAAMAGVLLGFLAGGTAHGQGVWELTPYRVRVLLAVERRPELTPRLVESIGDVLVQRTDTAIGAAWLLEVAKAPEALRSRMLGDMGGMTAEEIPADLLALKADKLIFVSVSGGPAGCVVTARECDLTTRLLSGSVSRWVPQRRMLGDEAFRAILDTFAPLARIEEVEDEKVIVRLRAAALPTLDSTLSWVEQGELFRPVIRFNDREGNPRRIEPLEWTFLRVERLDGPRLTCTIYSGLRSPLSGRRRGRVEQVALAVRSPAGPTRLVLRSQSDASTRLPGYEIYTHPPDSTTTRLVGRTDAQGELVIPADPPGLQILLVKNGAELLARLPLVPGLFPVAPAGVADDDQRLAAEGVIIGLQERFVDVIAQREVLITRVRSKIEQKELDEAQRLMERLRRLGSHQEFMQEITTQQNRLRSEDPRIQRKIKKLFEDTRQVVARFLDQGDIERLEAELAQALRTRTASAQ